MLTHKSVALVSGTTAPEASTRLSRAAEAAEVLTRQTRAAVCDCVDTELLISLTPRAHSRVEHHLRGARRTNVCRRLDLVGGVHVAWRGERREDHCEDGQNGNELHNDRIECMGLLLMGYFWSVCVLVC